MKELILIIAIFFLIGVTTAFGRDFNTILVDIENHTVTRTTGTLPVGFKGNRPLIMITNGERKWIPGLTTGNKK